MTPEGIVLVASVTILNHDQVLIIKETKPNARDKWNFPSGRMEYGEDILHTARREVREETGLEVNLTGTTGVYNFMSRTNNQVILFHFIGEMTGGILKLEEDEISDSKWVQLHELAKMENEDLREPGVLKQIIDNLLQNKVHSISMYNEPLRSN